ncbi:MAG: hypothetical protein EBX52_04315 [Proteobacteria bacterium]|nr:hypothetical protein [Pseudomonadota bacterium]
MTIFMRSFATAVFALFTAPIAAFAAPESIPHSYDPICQKYVSEQKFISGDTTYWEAKVLPNFRSVMESTKLDSEAKMNAKFKTMLASYGFYEDEISEYNSKRLISDCNKFPAMEGCFAMQAYCVRDFVKKELPRGIQTAIDCFKPWNQPYCGESFQTVQGIQTNLATYAKVNKDIQAIETKAQAKPFAKEYLSDVQTTFSDFSARVQQLMKDGNLAIEEAKKKEAARVAKEYDKDKTTVKNLGDAIKALEDCQAYLNQTGNPDTRAILDQVSSCQLNSSAVSAKDVSDFTKTLDQLKCSSSQFRKKDTADLVSKAYQASLLDTAQQYLAGHYGIKGSLPSKSAFCSKIGGCSKELNALYDEIVKSKDLLPKMNRQAQSDTFNQYVRELNAKCASAARAFADGTSKKKDVVNPVNQAYGDIIYKSGFGNLMGIGHFKDAVGEFDQKGCLENGVGLREIDPNGQGLSDALNESLQILADKVKGLQNEKSTILDPEDPYAGLRYFLEYDPLTLRALLRKTNDPGMAALMCIEIERIYKDESNRRNVSMALGILSIAGAVVATVLSGGAASPLLVAAIAGTSIAIGAGTGTYNYIVDKSQESQYRQSTVAGTFDQSVGQQLIDQYHFEGNVELVGIAASFAPAIGKGFVFAAEKTGATVLIRTEAELMKDAIKSAPFFEKAAQYSKPVADVFSKIGAGRAVALTEIQAGLASKVGPKTMKIMVTTFNAVTKDMPYNAAMVFGVHALAHPDPYSEQGILDCLESLAMAQGISALGTAGKSYLMQRRAALFQSGAMNYFDFEGRIATTQDAFEQANLMKQRDAFEKFKRDVNFDELSPAEKRAFIEKLYTVHKTGTVTEKGKPDRPKSEALIDLKNDIKTDLMKRNPGMTEAEAKKQAFAIVDGISNEDVSILGFKDVAKAAGDKVKSVYQGPEGKIKASNVEAGKYIQPADTKKIGEIFSDGTLTPKEKASRTFDVAFEARIKDFSPSEQKMMRDVLAKTKFKVSTDITSSPTTMKGPQEYFESVSYYQNLMKEMESQIQLKVKTKKSLRRTYQRYASSPGDFALALDEGALRSEHSFLSAIPKDTKDAMVSEINGWKLPESDKKILLASLKNADLPVDQYVKEQQGGWSGRTATKIKTNLTTGAPALVTKNLVWWAVCENIFTEDFAGYTDDAMERSEIYKNICKFMSVPATLVR